MDQFISLTNDRGLYKKILKEGRGSPPMEGSKVLIECKGALEDGTYFEDSPKDGKIIDLAHENLKGLEIGIKSMLVGEKAIFVMRDDYAYGVKGSLKVPANSPVIFCIDLINWT
jgi:FKBP-type peptidyl-prolyl cis-trans isomerase